jgi:hypothetical protein
VELKFRPQDAEESRIFCNFSLWVTLCTNALQCCQLLERFVGQICDSTATVRYSNWDKMRDIPTITFSHYSIWGHCRVGWVDIGTRTKVPMRFVTYLSKVMKWTKKVFWPSDHLIIGQHILGHALYKKNLGPLYSILRSKNFFSHNIHFMGIKRRRILCRFQSSLQKLQYFNLKWWLSMNKV